MTISKFSSKIPSDQIQVSLDFINDFVSTTEYIVSINWVVTVLSGVDATPSAILAGTGSFSKSIASHLVINGLDKVSYLITCHATTNLQVLTLSGILDVLVTPPAKKISNRQDLADYCLRQLGGGVINIEVSDDQIDDCIDSAIQYYNEYHFDGIERDYLIYKIIGTQITVADSTVFVKGQTISSLDSNTKAKISSISGNTLITNKQHGMTKFLVGDTVMGNLGSTTISGIILGDPDNGFITLTDDIYGIKKILNITSILGSADYMFNAQYQIMLSEIQNLTSAGTSYFYGVQQYLGHLDFIMKKEKDFRFNRRMHKLYLDIAWDSDLSVDDIVAAEVYRALDPEIYNSVYSDTWLRKYTTALIKKIWGSHLRKYQGMQLPGGVTFQGQVIYDEAVGEIKELENDAMYSSSPLEFSIG